MKKKIVWVTWESQRRNISMSSAINAILYEILYDDSPRIIRYTCSLVRTGGVLIKERPDVLIAQNPSLLLALFVVLMKKTNLFKFKLVVDAHNASILPFLSKRGFFSKYMVKLREFILKNTDTTIVTNNNLAEIVLGFGGIPLIVEDPLPIFLEDIRKKDLEGIKNFLFICSYADDEPYMNLIDAVRQLNKDIYVYMTGAPNPDVLSMSDRLPSNLILTGFLSKNQYDIMLFSVDAVIDLTTREDCLVCGAYEAVAAIKPLVLSDKKALRGYFGEDGIVYAVNEVDDIAQSIFHVAENLAQYKRGIQNLNIKLQDRWRKRKDELLLMLNY